MGIWAVVIIALLAAFNFFLADAMIRMRADVRATRMACKKILARIDATMVVSSISEAFEGSDEEEDDDGVERDHPM